MTANHLITKVLAPNLYIETSSQKSSSHFLIVNIWLHNISQASFGKFLRSYSELMSEFGAISFQEYVSKRITHPVFLRWSCLKTKGGQVKGAANFGSKILNRLHGFSITQRSSRGRYVLCLAILQPCTYLSWSIALWLLGSLVHMTGLVQTSSEATRSRYSSSSSLWLLVGNPSTFGPEIGYTLRVAKPNLKDVSR